MPRSRPIEWRFPILGLDTHAGYQSQPPFSTPDCLNVFTRSTMESRETGGTRPGFFPEIFTYANPGSSGAVRMLGSVNYPADNPSQTYAETFTSSTLDGNWAAAGDSGMSGSRPRVYRNRWCYQPYVANEIRGVYRAGYTTYDLTNNSHMLRMFIVPDRGAINGKYTAFVKVGSNYGANGLRFVLYRSSTTKWKLLVTERNGSVTIADSSMGEITTDMLSGWLTIYVNGTATSDARKVVAYWNQNVFPYTHTHNAALDIYDKFGFALEATADGNVYIDRFNFSYYPSASPPIRAARQYAVASANGKLAIERHEGQFADVTPTGMTLGTSGTIDCVQMNEKLYIADWMNPATLKITDGKYDISTGFPAIKSVANPNLQTALGSTNNQVWRWGIYIQSAGTSGLSVGHYSPTGFTDGTGLILFALLSADHNQGLPHDGASTGSDAVVVVHRIPKEYDPSTGTVRKLGHITDTAVAYNVPTNCTLIASYFNRIYLAGDSFNPHVWYASRSGNVHDFDYGAPDDDYGRAVLGTTQSFDSVPVAGLPITAMIPFENDYMLFGFTDAIGLLRGDPLLGGTMSFLARGVGVITRGGWCYTPYGAIIVSRDGVYRIRGLNVESVSRERIPQLLLDINPETDTLTMAYDQFARGAYITHSRGIYNVRSYFMDDRTGSFWPITTGSIIVCSSQHLRGDSERPSAMFGCYDGYVRQFNHLCERDDSGAFDSYVIYGPFEIGNDRSEAQLVRLYANLTVNSADVLLQTYVASTAEECLDLARSNGAGITISSPDVFQATLRAGGNPALHPRCRGQWIALRLQRPSDGVRGWSVEGIGGQVVKTGAPRMIT